MRFLIKSMSIFLFASIVILAGCVAEKTADNNIEIDKESRGSEVAAALHGESKSWKENVIVQTQ